MLSASTGVAYFGGGHIGIISSESTPDSPLFVLKTGDAAATAKLIHGEFIVLQGSLARKESTPSIHTYLEKMRQKLRAAKVLEEISGGHSRFTVNYAFKSPSTAAGVVTGRSSNGRQDWKVKESGQTYGEWDEKRLAEPS